MNTLTKILSTIISHDPTMSGFAADNLPDAARGRIQNTIVSLESIVASDDLDTVRRWIDGAAAPVEVIREGECAYMIYADGSLYFLSSGDSEVWSSASDFADERILNGYSGTLDKMDDALLRHLDGVYAEEADSRGVRA